MSRFDTFIAALLVPLVLVVAGIVSVQLVRDVMFYASSRPVRIEVLSARMQQTSFDLDGARVVQTTVRLLGRHGGVTEPLETTFAGANAAHRAFAQRLRAGKGVQVNVWMSDAHPGVFQVERTFPWGGAAAVAVTVPFAVLLCIVAWRAWRGRAAWPTRRDVS